MVQTIAPEAGELEKSMASTTVAFHLRPSVGTWLTPALQIAQAVAPKLEELEKSTVSEPVAFYLRPSVGTWLTPLVPAHSVDEAAPIVVEEMTTTAAQPTGDDPAFRHSNSDLKLFCGRDLLRDLAAARNPTERLD
eukprot:9764240-Heterocapsa_arctica.AAC.1